KHLEQLEREAINEYDSVVGANHVDDEITYFHIKDVVLPKYRNFIEELEALRPETKEVRNVHEIYIKGSNLQYNGMVSLLSALENQDFDKLNEANQQMQEAKIVIR